MDGVGKFHESLKEDRDNMRRTLGEWEAALQEIRSVADDPNNYGLHPSAALGRIFCVAAKALEMVRVCCPRCGVSMNKIESGDDSDGGYLVLGMLDTYKCRTRCDLNAGVDIERFLRGAIGEHL